MADDFDSIVILNNEDGEEVKFNFLDLVEYEGSAYVVLLPLEEGEENSEVVILELEDTDDGEMESYMGVEDEETLMAVFNIFKEKFKDEINFVDD